MTLTKKRFIAIIFFIFVLVFTTWLELYIQKNPSMIGGGLNRTFLFLFINTHIVIAIVLLYLIIRHSIKLFLERRKGTPGSAFKSNLLFAFTLFSVIPSFFIFFTAGKFITNSIDRWFQAHIESGLKSALSLHKQQTQAQRDILAYHGLVLSNTVSKYLTFHHTQPTIDQQEVHQYLTTTIPHIMNNYTVYILNDIGHGIVGSLHDEKTIWRKFRTTNDRTTHSLKLRFFHNITNVSENGGCFDFYGSLYWAKKIHHLTCIIVHRYPESIRAALIGIENSLSDYEHLYSVRSSIYVGYLFTFLAVVLLIFFLSLWCAFYLAKGITKPIQELLEATERIRQGDWQTRIVVDPSSDLQSLSRGFNEMTEAVQTAQTILEHKNKELLAILENISAAVFVINNYGRIIFHNSASQNLANSFYGNIQLKGKRCSIFGQEVIQKSCNIIRELTISGQEHITQEISFTVGEQTQTFMVYGRLVSVASHNQMPQHNVLIVIEDLTQIVKINKMKTWQEAAKQMAHEIKNPLTPIQLATQRLQRKYREVSIQDPVFLQCTNTILDQVKTIKDLVTHFSHFASMPQPSIEQIDLTSLIQSIFCLYQTSYPDITFVYDCYINPLQIKTDKQKIRLVIINLLDNSIRALKQTQGNNKNISLSISIHTDQNKLLFIFSDNGPGIATVVKESLFLPYVSTEKKNMGLGLAIVHDIITQLGGTISLVPTPVGATFHIELPL